MKKTIELAIYFSFRFLQPSAFGALQSDWFLGPSSTDDRSQAALVAHCPISLVEILEICPFLTVDGIGYA